MALKTGVLLLSSCWKHYSMLLRLEDHQFPYRINELIDQFLSGIEFCSDDEPKENEESIKETRKFFLNCLALLLGRLDSKRLARMMTEYGMRTSNSLLEQLHCADEDLITGVVCIFKLAIFKTTSNDLNNLGEIEEILPKLWSLLDKYDSASRAAVAILAHYCSISTNSQSCREVLKYSTSGNVPRRRNAIDFISELIRISEISASLVSDTKEDIANYLLECLEDDESVIQNQAIKIIPLIEPPRMLPAVIRLIYSSHATINSAASNAFVEILRHHNESFEVVSLLLDSMSNLRQAHDQCTKSEEVRDVSTIDIDHIFKLIPEWSETVQNWNSLIGPLLEKAFSDPSNATIVRFLSCISEHLADAADLVLGCLLLQAQKQKIDESIFSRRGSETCENDGLENLQHMLFDRLCPLLIIKLLPLRIFNDLASSIIYGQYLSQGSKHFDISGCQCLAAYMLNRAFSQFEFQDVRKLSAELCGRIHPQVLYPVVLSQLELAAELRDTLRIKACLFTVCTSLAVRGWDAISHPILIRTRKILQAILLWPSVDGDEVAKAQHGCIDCLALMICAELQDPSTSVDPVLEKAVGGNTSSLGSSLDFVINFLTDENLGVCFPPGVNESRRSQTMVFPLSFRLCMANVLISACQKVPDSCKKTFAQKTLFHLIQSVKNLMDQEMRAACIHVLFSAVYHLKLAVLPYSSPLLDISLQSIRGASERERVAGAKLLGCLLGSDDRIVESISGRVFEARSILSVISKSDASADLRQICQKLLVCFT